MTTMTSIQKIAIVVGVLLLGAVIGFVSVPRTPAAGGIYNTQIPVYSNGIVNGDRVGIIKAGTIGAGANQTSWTNTTGRTLYIGAADILFGYPSGTASSSWLVYVGTSTAASFADYSRPSGDYLPIDGAVVATNTAARAGLRVGTTTTASPARGAIQVNPGENLVFDVQERYACKTVGACETATSSNRGASSFFWQFKATYTPQF